MASAGKLIPKSALLADRPDSRRRLLLVVQAVDPSFGDRQHGDDHHDRAGDEEDLVPAALMGQQHGRRGHAGNGMGLLGVLRVDDRDRLPDHPSLLIE